MTRWVTGQNAKSLTNNSRENGNTRVKENGTLTESQPGWGKALSQAVEHKDKQLPVRRQDAGPQYPWICEDSADLLCEAQ